MRVPAAISKSELDRMVPGLVRRVMAKQQRSGPSDEQLMERSLLLSAARSEIFNAALAARTGVPEENIVIAENGAVVALRAPGDMGLAGFISRVENLPVRVDTPAKVVIDEVNGVIVMGEAVRVSTVAIAQGNLTVSVQETPQVIQPAPFSQGQTAVVPDTQVAVEEELGREMRIVRGGESLSTVVNGLNALGVSPRDMISILQAIKAAGALQADIEVM